MAIIIVIVEVVVIVDILTFAMCGEQTPQYVNYWQSLNERH